MSRVSSGRVPAWESHLFIGTHGHVIAIIRKTGRRAWVTSLPKTGYSIVSIVVEDGVLYCGSGGRVFALDPSNGSILWKNDLRGLGSGMVYMTTASSSQQGGLLSLMAQQAANEAAAAAAV